MYEVPGEITMYVSDRVSYLMMYVVRTYISKPARAAESSDLMHKTSKKPDGLPQRRYRHAAPSIS